MHFLIDFFSHLHNLDELIRWGGYLVLALIVFTETGLFFGFFLPGDSLLVTAGLFAARGDLSIVFLAILIPVCAIIGDALGFEIGRVSGRVFFSKTDSRWFKVEHLQQTQAFYDKHGGKAIIMARFMPIVRTFAPLVAGIGGMPYRRFVLYNVLGGIVWSWLMLGIGYGLGRTIPHIDNYIQLVIAIVIFLSLLPGIVGYLKNHSTRTS